MRRKFFVSVSMVVACSPSGLSPMNEQTVETDWMPHAEDQAQPHLEFGEGQLDPYVSQREPEDRPDVTVYGYWPYWGESLETLAWDQLTHLALFGVELSVDGGLTEEDRWHSQAPLAVALAEEHGVRVHLTLICFSDEAMASVLPDPTRRARAISEVASLVSAYDAHGVNLDFEGLDVAYKHDFTAFVEEMSEVLEDVFVATPAVDWDGAYDYDALAFASEGLFIMGYGYHWSRGDPGPVAPLDGGTPWGSHSLSWSVEDHLKWGAPASKIILGLPLYGRLWPTTSMEIPGEGTGEGVAVTYGSAKVLVEDHDRYWDSATTTPYLLPTSREQLWYDDAESLEAKMAYAVDSNLQGFGFWALTYAHTDAGLWGAVDALSHGD
jgi:hypothetical protein